MFLVFAVEVPASGAEQFEFGTGGDEAFDGVKHLDEVRPVRCNKACAEPDSAVLVLVADLRGGHLEAPFQLGDKRPHEGAFLLQAVHIAEEDVEFDPPDPHSPIINRQTGERLNSALTEPSRTVARWGQRRRAVDEEDRTDKISEAASEGADAVGGAVDGARESTAVRAVARAGFIAVGAIHLLIGVIALRIALGESGQADQSGAVGQMAATPVGGVLLWAGLIACGALALYMASDAVMGWSGSRTSKKLEKRIRAAGQAVVFAVSAVTFGSFAVGHPSNSSEKSRTVSAGLMSNPAGTVLLVVIGAALIGAAVTYGVLGITRKYEKNLRGHPHGALGTTFTVLGVVGYCAKGVALGAVGLLILVATFAHDPSQQGGLDAALKAFRAQPFGVVVLAGVGVGLIAYGIFSLFRSRYQRL